MNNEDLKEEGLKYCQKYLGISNLSEIKKLVSCLPDELKNIFFIRIGLDDRGIFYKSFINLNKRLGINNSKELFYKAMEYIRFAPQILLLSQEDIDRLKNSDYDRLKAFAELSRDIVGNVSRFRSSNYVINCNKLIDTMKGVLDEEKYNFCLNYYGISDNNNLEIKEYSPRKKREILSHCKKIMRENMEKFIELKTISKYIKLEGITKVDDEILEELSKSIFIYFPSSYRIAMKLDNIGIKDGVDLINLDEERIAEMDLLEEEKEKIRSNIKGIKAEVMKKNTHLTKELFEEILNREDFVEFYLNKSQKELKNDFGPEVTKMVGFNQKNAHHCYDLWEHTLRTVQSIDKNNLTEEQVKKLKIAAFFHDIGKPDVADINPKTGQQTFYNHAKRSAEIARPILKKLGYNENEIVQIAFLIEHHDDFINYKIKLDKKLVTHPFLREINQDTLGEVIIKNKYDFNKLGFRTMLPTKTKSETQNKLNLLENRTNKLKIQYICAALSNNGANPNFRDSSGNLINIFVNIFDIQSQIYSGDCNAEYVPNLEDYRLLLRLCKADINAQSEEVKITDNNGKEIVVDTKKRKLKAIKQIEFYLPKAYKMVETRSEYLEEIYRKIKLSRESQDAGDKGNIQFNNFDFR